MPALPVPLPVYVRTDLYHNTWAIAGAGTNHPCRAAVGTVHKRMVRASFNSFTPGTPHGPYALQAVSLKRSGISFVGFWSGLPSRYHKTILVLHADF